MNAIVVDDQELSLDILLLQLHSLDYFDDIQSFTDPTDAIVYAKSHEIDVAFLDIMMDNIDGITLASAIKTYLPDCYVIFTTASTDHALDAFQVHASGYLVKPVTKESIKEQLDSLFGRRTKPVVKPVKPLRVQCFGNFEVFDSNGKPLKFQYRKSKELLAYLIDRRGAACSNEELAAVLYEDREDSSSLQSQIRNLIADVNRSLREANASSVLYREHGHTAIMPDEIDCDYYNYVQDQSSTPFLGEYMTQYSWAEPVTSYLLNLQ